MEKVKRDSRATAAEEKPFAMKNRSGLEGRERAKWPNCSDHIFNEVVCTEVGFIPHQLSFLIICI